MIKARLFYSGGGGAGGDGVGEEERKIYYRPVQKGERHMRKKSKPKWLISG